MAKITNLFKEKIYIFNREKGVFETEREMADKIFSQFSNGIQNIEFVDANMHNDIFKVKSVDDEDYYLKLSLEDEPNFLKEHQILFQNFHKKVSPEPIVFGQLKDFGNINYSVITSIPTFNIKEYGIAEILNNKKTIPEYLSLLTSFSHEDVNLPTFNQYANHYLTFDVFKVPDISINSFESHENIKDVAKKQVVVLQKIIAEKLNNLNLNKNHFCHGNLNQSTILGATNCLFFINFENAYLGDFLFEVLNLKYELFYSNHVENDILKYMNNDLKLDLNFSQLRLYKELSCYWNLLKICVDYLEEVFVLKSQRQNKILNIAARLSKNYENFYQLPDFDKNFKPIAELFVESVI